MPKNLFEHEAIYLAPIDPERDAEVEALWTHNPAYLRALGMEPARPLSPSQVKKRYEALEKEMDEQGRTYYFSLRTRADDRLIGFLRLTWVEWSNGNAWLTMGIGDPRDRRRGYGSQAIELVLHYAFEELGLHRISIGVPGYNQAATRFFERHGFSVEVRRREALQRDLRRWDMVLMGLLRTEWPGAMT